MRMILNPYYHLRKRAATGGLRLAGGQAEICEVVIRIVRARAPLHRTGAPIDRTLAAYAARASSRVT